MKTSIKEYVFGLYKASDREINCEGLSRLHEMESENGEWVDMLNVGIVASMEGEL